MIFFFTPYLILPEFLSRIGRTLYEIYLLDGERQLPLVVCDSLTEQSGVRHHISLRCNKGGLDSRCG